MMNRVLIVAGERQTGERYQEALGLAGFQTAVVWNPMQMVEFCRQHQPDYLLVDLDLSDYGLWSALQAVKSIGALANIPFLGLSSTGNPQILEKARAAGFANVYPTHESAKLVVGALSEMADQNDNNDAEPDFSEDLDVTSRDPSLNRLREITRDIVQTTVSLKSRLDEYGEDGPELFGYIEASGAQIRKKLNSVEDYSLHDKTLRHDFRNMIGSVTGFAELILMEQTLSPEATVGLSRLRERSREFVEILDDQKAEATA